MTPITPEQAQNGMYPNSSQPYPGYPPQQQGNPPQCPYPPQQQQGYSAPPYPPQQQQQQQYPPGPGFSVQQPGYPANPGSFGSVPAYPPSPFGVPGLPQGYSQSNPYPTAASEYPGYPTGQQQFQQASAYPTAGSQQQQYPPAQGYPAPGAQYQQQQPSAYPPAGAQSYQPGSGGGYPGAPAQGHYPNPASGQGSAPQAQSAMSLQQYQDVPSIAHVNADPQADAQLLRKAMKGFGTDEKTIISCLTRRTDPQRQAICTAFKASFGKDLLKDLKSELGGKLEDVILALMTPRYDFLAQMLRKAISGIGTKESLLVDILCSSNNQEIRQICATYQRIFGVPLERDLKGDTSGAFMRLLVSISTGGRSEDPNVNQALAAEDAQKLLSAGVKKWGTDESMFNMILATRSYPHLRMVFHEYERLTGHAFERAIQREFSGDIEVGMLAIVKCAKNRAAYFAQRLHDSIAGFGTKDNDLIFIMVSRADVDLGSICGEYQKMYNKSLANDISGDTSGDYKKVLLGLLGQ